MKSLYKWWIGCILGSMVDCATLPVSAQVTSSPEAPAISPVEDNSKLMNFFKGVEISGFVDTYYMYNFSKPKDNLGSGGDFIRPDLLEVRAFDREHDSFTLDNIEISVFKPSTEKDPIGFGFTTNYGEIARRLTFVPAELSGGTARADGEARVDDDDFTVSQGFITYKAPVGKGIDFKFGKFATWIGAELWESVDNPNFSRSLLYNNAIAFTNTGLAIGYPVLDSLTVTYYLVNGWDTFVDNNNAKTHGYQFNWKITETTNLILNGSHGPEQNEDLDPGAEGNWRHFWDVIFAIKPFEKTAFNLNFDFGTEKDAAGSAGGFVRGHGTGKWWGFSGIVIQDITDSLGVAVRGEYFDDSDGARLGVTGLRLWELTGTVNIKIRENLLVRPEVRYDQADDKEVFAGQDNQLTTAIDVAFLF